MDILIINNGSGNNPAKRKRYGFWKFMGDALMTWVTSGLWLVWVLIRWYINKNSR